MISPYYGKFKVTQQFKSTHDGLDLVGIDSKEIHSTINGVVEKAGWENANNHSQGFGQYVRILKDGTKDKYYFGHMSQIKVKAGQKVSVGTVLGIEGSTGYSTGSHCHYCVREDGSKSKIKDIVAISGIPNKLGQYSYTPATPKPQNTTPAQPEKTTEQLAQEVLQGLWGNGEERKRRLGSRYAEVQKKVNELAAKKSNPAPAVQYYPTPAYKGASLVDALKSIRVDSSMANRTKIATKNGIEGYAGTVLQNTKLLNLLKSGKLVK